MSRLTSRVSVVATDTRAVALRGPVEPPLCVDLDGMLVSTDVLWESVLWLLKRAPLTLLRCLVQLVHGRAALKAAIAARAPLDPASLPYRKDVVHWLRRERDHGRRCVLVTAASQQQADAVAAHLGLFADVLGSTATVDLSGERKRRALEQRFGVGRFDDAGLRRPGQEFGRAARAALRAMRVHQWVKNVLVMAPLLLGHVLFDLTAVGRTALTFMAFCLCASSVYVLNDLLDLRADRAHPLKCARPFAAGALSIPTGLVMVPLLLGGAALIGLMLPRAVSATLAAYLVLTTAYSFRLKGIAILDVVVLAVLYTLRVLAGNLAIDQEVSAWLIALSIFLFQSLAMQKRYAEFGLLEADGARLNGRGYVKADAQLLGSAGPASGYLAVLVLALYIHSDEVIRLYAQPKVLWAVCPLVLYWITHMWLRAHRGQITDDPIVVALTDRVSWIVGAGVVLTMLAAMVEW